MALPADPVSGEYRLTNPGVDDRWTCPNCYADQIGYDLDGATIVCSCGATLELTIEQQPVCVATCIDPEKNDD